MRDYEEVIEYIVFFLTGTNCYKEKDGIDYVESVNTDSNSKILIIKSNFFNSNTYMTSSSMPTLPLKELNEIPILFGEPKIEEENGKNVIYADLIASTFFLISRYEEILRRKVRDIHGRFIGKESLPYKAKFIHRPIVDEYGILLKELLGYEKTEGFESIYLTHDVDIPWEHFTLIGAIKRILGDFKRKHTLNLYPLKNVFGIVEEDPYYTFPYLMEMDKNANGAKTVYFLTSGGYGNVQDGYVYINSSACHRLIDMIKKSGAVIGYHASYQASAEPSYTSKELDALERVLGGGRVLWQRNHFLDSREPEDFRNLIECGITDDFTMGYADVAGFRLGTSKEVKWIDSINLKVTDLSLHPLTIMECTLSSEAYMNLSEDAAMQYAFELIKEVRSNNGELVLLWHNTSFTDENRDMRLYETIIRKLEKE